MTSDATVLPAILQDVVDALADCGPRAKIADLRGRLLFTTTDAGTVRTRLQELRELDRVMVEHHGGESYWSLVGQRKNGEVAVAPPAPKRKYQRRAVPAPTRAPEPKPEWHDEQETDEVREQQRADEAEREREREKRERKEQREREFQAIRDAADRAEVLEVELRRTLLDKLPTFDNGWDPSVQGAWFASFQKLMAPL